ncbi:MAG TPA: class I SAM-dependent rRNA methyltransferase [Anaerolineae bacterium]|nr:class I SAM-dependent rRNA methyltransferase [Anaerolineae bacterium]
MTATVMLKRGRDKPVRNRHPWIFSGAVARIDGEAEDGDIVRVTDDRGRYLAAGYVNRRSQIVVRLLTWDEQEIDTAFWRRRIARAVEGRRGITDSNACRLIYAESDGLPGLVVDRYGDWLVVQSLTLGIAQRRDELVALLAEMVEPAGIYARDDVDVRSHEGLSQETGSLWGEDPPDRIEIVEHGHRFLVDVKRGHKTGFYLDQRQNRQRAAAYCPGADVLNAFAYSGAFAVYAAGAGARSVLNVDSSIPALELAEENLALNGLAPQEMLAGDVFEVLRDYRAEGQSYDVIVLDPPKFATSQAEVMNASRGYKDLNLLAMQLLRPGGVLVTFSCSGRVDADLFQKIVFAASVDAGRDAQIVEWLAQARDHPVLLTFPESWYLKGFICRVW